jgi:hypothetical protein
MRPTIMAAVMKVLGIRRPRTGTARNSGSSSQGTRRASGKIAERLTRNCFKGLG